MTEGIISGVVTGTVTDREDPEGEGRVEVTFPWLDDGTRSAWAPIAAPMSGPGRGAFFMPEIDDEVLVAFEHGQFDHPFIVGFLWNGQDRPPSEDNRQRMIQSVNGHTIRFLDSTPTGGNSGGIVIEDGMGNRIVMTQAKISITSTALLELEAPIISLKSGGAARIVRPVPQPI